jgi:hypothetical protein
MNDRLGHITKLALMLIHTEYRRCDNGKLLLLFGLENKLLHVCLMLCGIDVIIDNKFGMLKAAASRPGGVSVTVLDQQIL